MPLGDPTPDISAGTLALDALQRGVAALTANRVDALRWLERACRLAPSDPNASLMLASALLTDDPERAATLFSSVIAQHDVRQAWMGLAAAHLRMSGPDVARSSLAVLLSRYAFNPETTALAEAISAPFGWCALRPDGRLEINPPKTPDDPVHAFLDGKPVHGTILPSGWESGRAIDIRAGSSPLVGSPIDIKAIRRIAGCIQVRDGGIEGWAWYPADPDTPPALTLMDSTGHMRRQFAPTNESSPVADTGPLARARLFTLTREDLQSVSGAVRILGPDGRDLLGSPLDPFRDEAAQILAARRLGQLYPAAKRLTVPDATFSLPLRADAPVPPRPAGADRRTRAVTIVIPVHDGGQIVIDCLDSVLTSLPAGVQVLIVDDGSADPALTAALDGLVRQKKLALLRHPKPQGFPSAANAGIRAAGNRDVILLNSDTLVPPGWVERLRQAAYAAPDVGTVTPISNDASIVSYPGPSGTNAIPDQGATTRLDQAAFRANAGTTIDIPVGVGFCLYLRRDCLDTVGLFRADLFAQGYGEENDFCFRARRLGWRNVALTGLFVGHLGGASFGPGAIHLRARNSRMLEQLHPGYQASIETFCARDPLADCRRRIDLHRWRQRRPKPSRSAILITHADGGGVEQRLIHAIEQHQQSGRRVVVLRPARTAAGIAAIAVQDGTTNNFPNLVYAMPGELPALLRLLRATGPERIDVHHLASHSPAIYRLIISLHIPYDIHIHDYAWFCPRISLVGAYNRYCGEPNVAACEACVADHGHFLQETIGVADLRRRSADFLFAARQIIVPSEDTAARMRRQFDGLVTITAAHEDDAAITAARPRPRPDTTTSICVVGAIGVHKGYDILLACARDAAERDLDLRFIVVGHTIDDTRMLATGRIFITGRFEPSQAVELIAQQNASLGFVTSVCPETWCLSLGDLWRAGLAAAAFDIGAPAERIRATGRGILLPLGLSVSAINNTLVAAASMSAH